MTVTTGTLMVSTHLPGTQTHLFAEYELDDARKALRNAWEYGRGVADWPAERGMVAKLSMGNRLANYGSAGVIVEITPDGRVVWRVEFGDRLLGLNTLVADLYALNRGPR